MKTQLILACSIVAINGLLAQDIETLSPNSNWVQLNPAYAGSNGGFRTQLNTSSSLNPNSMQQFGFSSDLYFTKIKSGISLSVNNLQLGNGIMMENAYSIGYSKRFGFKGNKIEMIPALQISVLHKVIDIQALNFEELIDSRFAEQFTFVGSGLLPVSQKKALDLSAGTLVDLQNGFVIGFSARHLTQPDMGVYGFMKLPTKYVMHASYDKVIDESTLLNVVMILWAQNGTEEAKMQTSAVFKKHLYVGLGAGTSNNYKIGTVLLGYKGNFWSITSVLGTRYFPETAFFWNRAELALAVNIRDKEVRKSLTYCSRW